MKRLACDGVASMMLAATAAANVIPFERRDKVQPIIFSSLLKSASPRHRGLHSGISKLSVKFEHA